MYHDTNYPQQPPMYNQQSPPQQGLPQDQIAPQFRCPAGNSHFYKDEFTCCGICLAVCFFPIGLVCCYVMKDKKCVKCGQSQPN